MATPTFAKQGIKAMQSGCQIGGSTIWTFGSAMGPTVPVPNRIGDILINYSTGKMYIAGAATATTDWKLVTSA